MAETGDKKRVLENSAEDENPKKRQKIEVNSTAENPSNGGEDATSDKYPTPEDEETTIQPQDEPKNIEAELERLKQDASRPLAEILAEYGVTLPAETQA